MLCLGRNGRRYFWTGDKSDWVDGETAGDAKRRCDSAYDLARQYFWMKPDPAWRYAVSQICGVTVNTPFDFYHVPKHLEHLIAA